jgi:hypothetical protein
VKPQPGEKVVAVRCQPKTYPCPRCGRRGRRKRRLGRFVRSLAYARVVWLHVEALPGASVPSWLAGLLFDPIASQTDRGSTQGNKGSKVRFKGIPFGCGVNVTISP